MQSPCESFAKWLKQQEVDEVSDTKSTIVVSPKLIGIARDELERLVKLPGNVEPERGNLNDPTIEWRTGKPNYTLANLAFLKGKCMSHEKGSLEMIVENAVKTWEMEASHKVDTAQWKTIVHDKYSVQANNKKSFNLDEASAKGNYNVLMDHVEKNLYDADKEDFESSHHLFLHAFESSFPWEVLEVFVGPPNIVFSWRHWGEFTGEYKGNKGDGELLEMTGFACVSVTDELKITNIKVYYTPEAFLKALRGEKSREEVNFHENKVVESLIKNFMIKDSKVKLEVNGDEVKTYQLDKNFIKTFHNNFPFEVVKVFSKGKEIAFSWQHSMKVKENIELKGFAIVTIDENDEIDGVKVFYKPRDVPDKYFEKI